MSASKIATISGIILALTIAPTHATVSDKKEQLCRSVSKQGAVIMTLRQQGTSMPKIVRHIKAEAKSEKSKLLALKLAKAAYDKPKYTTQEYKEKAITTFANSIFQQCLKSDLHKHFK